MTDDSRRGDTDSVVVVARSVDAVEQLRSRWQQMAVGNIDADIDYFLAVVGHDPTVLRPHVVLVERAGKSPLLIVGRIVRQSFPLQVGYRTLTSPTAPTILIAFDGVVGLRDDDDVATVIATLSRHLDAGEADVVRFQKVDMSATLYGEANRAVGWMRRAHGMHPIVNRWTDLPNSWDDFLAARSGRSRRDLRYWDRKFEKKHGGAFDVRRLDRPEYRAVLRQDLEAVAGSSYQRELGVGIDGNPLWQGLISVALDHDWLRIWMLYIDDRPVSFWWATVYDCVAAPYTPAYDPEFAEDRVGRYTMMRMLEDLCNDADVSRLDFLYGDAGYKQRFSSHSTNTVDVLLFAARPRPLALNAFISLGALMTGTAKDLIARSERLKNLQRRIRSRARGQATDGSGT